MMRADAVVVGGGMSGMALALLLARNGRKVALVEEDGKLAPVLRGFSRRGILFNTGFHYTGGLGPGGLLDRLFRALGVAGDIAPVPYRADCADRFVFRGTGFEFRYPVGERRIRSALLAAFPGEDGAIARYVDAVNKVVDAFPYTHPERMESEYPSVSANQTLAQVLDSLTANPLLKGVFSGHRLLYGVSSQEVPFAFHAGIVGSYFSSAHTLDGGGRALVAALERRMEEAGVTVRRGRGVRSIRLGSGGVEGVTLADGERLGAPLCVLTAHPRLLLELVAPESFSPAFRGRIASLEDSCAAFLLFGAFRADGEGLGLSNRFFFPGTEPFLGAFCGGLAAAMEDRPFYLTFASHPQPGEEKGFIAVFPASAEESAWERDSLYESRKLEATRRMQEMVETHCPEIDGRISWVEASTPASFRRRAHSPTGSLYGVKHTVNQINPLPRTRVKGLYLSGQATIAPGILGATLSAFRTGEEILGRDTVRRQVMECA